MIRGRLLGGTRAFICVLQSVNLSARLPLYRWPSNGCRSRKGMYTKGDRRMHACKGTNQPAPCLANSQLDSYSSTGSVVAGARINRRTTEGVLHTVADESCCCCSCERPSQPAWCGCSRRAQHGLGVHWGPGRLHQPVPGLRQPHLRRHRQPAATAAAEGGWRRRWGWGLEQGPGQGHAGGLVDGGRRRGRGRGRAGHGRGACARAAGPDQDQARAGPRGAGRGHRLAQRLPGLQVGWVGWGGYWGPIHCFEGGRSALSVIIP